MKEKNTSTLFPGGILVVALDGLMLFVGFSFGALKTRKEQSYRINHLRTALSIQTITNKTFAIVSKMSKSKIPKNILEVTQKFKQLRN